MRAGLHVAAVEAAALAGVAGPPRPVDQRQQRIGVAVVAQRLDALDVARGLPLVPELVARAAPEVHLSGLARALEGRLVDIGEREHLAGAPILHHAWRQAVGTEFDLHAGDY